MIQATMTFDVDWAPDWAVDFCLNECAGAKIPATLFVTHESQIVKSSLHHSEFEFGIHPNFQGSSTQGSNLFEVLQQLMKIVPNARSMRTHSLLQSSRILEYTANLTNIKNDVSLFLPFSRELPITTINFPNTTLTRLPFSWEDDEAMCRPNWDWKVETWPGQNNGRFVWNFHPIHVILNTSRFDSYAELIKFLGDRPLFELKESEALRFREGGDGTLTYFRELLKHREWQWVNVTDVCDEMERNL